MLSIQDSVPDLYVVDDPIYILAKTSQKLWELKLNYPEFDTEFFPYNTTNSEKNESKAVIFPLYNGKRLRLLPLPRPGKIAEVDLGTGEVQYLSPYSGCYKSHIINTWEGGAYIEGSSEKIEYEELETFWQECIEKIETIFGK
jgi:hypothetical protein